MGFLKNDVYFSYNKDIFNNYHRNYVIFKKEKMDITGYSTFLESDKLNELKSAIGEFFEREALINFNNDKNHYFYGIDLLTGDLRKIEKSKLVFNNDFVDSTGMASHLSSHKLIINSFKEFYERQSYIFNYLSNGSSEKLEIKFSDELKKYDDYLHNFIDNINYFDIGLDSRLHVILSLGYGKFYKAAGLGCDFNIKNAIKKSQQEIIQYFMFEEGKKNRSYQKTDEYSTIRNNLYSDNFKKINIKVFLEDYSYLLKEKTSKVVTLNDNLYNIYDEYSIIEDICKKNEMNPELYFINYRMRGSTVKVSKVIDKKWFPHMLPQLYKKEVFENIEKIKNCKLKKDQKILPFG